MSQTIIERMVGVWDYEGRSTSALDEVRTGTETITRRGAWLVIESDDGARFQLAFDAESPRVHGDFIHWDDPTLWVYEGVLENDLLTLNSRGPRMEGGAGETSYQDIWKITSPDERRLTGRFLDDNGVWQDFTTTIYRRRA